jgi:hypothetical protein
MRYSNNGHGGTDQDSMSTSAGERSDTHNLIGNHNRMKLIPWADIWTSLRVAKIRGNGEMIEVFYDTLFKEAIFDDNGAWALDIKHGT